MLASWEFSLIIIIPLIITFSCMSVGMLKFGHTYPCNCVSTKPPSKKSCHSRILMMDETRPCQPATVDTPGPNRNVRGDDRPKFGGTEQNIAEQNTDVRTAWPASGLPTATKVQPCCVWLYRSVHWRVICGRDALHTDAAQGCSHLQSHSCVWAQYCWARMEVQSAQFDTTEFSLQPPQTLHPRVHRCLLQRHRRLSPCKSLPRCMPSQGFHSWCAGQLVDGQQ